MSTYNITGSELHQEIKWALLENLTPTTIWSEDEISQYLNDRQTQLIHETGVVAKFGTISAIAFQNRHATPIDTVAVRRASWKPASGTIKSLHRADAWMLDNMVPEWRYKPGTPKIYHENTLSGQEIEIYPAALTQGVINLIYLSLETAIANNALKVSVPDEFVCYIKWGAIADCLRKTGPAQDLPRAAYAEERFEEGIELGQFLMGFGGGDD